MRKRTVVLVDDDRSMVRLLESTLQTAFPDQLRLVSTTDTEQARFWLSQRSCDLLVSDIEMPGTDGLEMLRLARHCNSWTRVIFLTGHRSWERIAEAIENGASDYLLKPVEPPVLIEIIRQEFARLDRWQGAVRGALQPSGSDA